MRKISQALAFRSATPGLLRCEGSLTNGQTEKPKNNEPDYDKLLHRRKGSTGTEFAGVGLQFAITIVLFAFAGIWLDKRFGTSPWLLLLMVFGGAGLGFWSMYRRLMGKKDAGGGKP